MKNGGARPGAGRKVGSTGKKAQAFLERVLGSGKTPLEVMLEAMRESAPRRVANEAEPEFEMRKRQWRERVQDAAKAAAPYCHPKLMSQVNPQDPTQPPVTKLEISFVRAA